jgi:hypothetical protein
MLARNSLVPDAQRGRGLDDMSVPFYLEYLSKVMDLAYNTAMKGGRREEKESSGLDGAGESKEVSPAYILTDEDVDGLYAEYRQKKEKKE